jgi:hypothetical protein
MKWPIVKTIEVESRAVKVSAKKVVQKDQSVVICATATIGNVSYAENWRLPRGNPKYTQEQGQKDFLAHLLKVATEAAGRKTAHEIAEHLT